MSYIGIDVGTTGCKALAFDEDANILASAYREYALISPENGWYELNPDLVVNECKKVIGEISNKVKNDNPVKAIGISSQGEAFTLLDKSDGYLCNAMVSSDIRSQKQVEEFTRSFGLKKLYKITGHSPHTLFSVFKLKWMVENSPDIVGKASKFLCFGDLLCYRLTGQAATSHNLAARTMLFDVTNLCWSEDILQAINIDKSILPESMLSGQPAGQLLPEIATELSLSKDVVVTVGGHDQSCGALGVGITGAGKAAYSIGTVECITPAFSGCVLNDTMQQSNFATYPFVIEGLYTTVAFIITGGNLLRWYRDNFAECELQQAEITGRDVYDIILSDIPDEPTNIFVQPHFVSAGTPYFDPNPTGAIIGLSLNNSKGDVVKALLEGVTYEMKLNLRLLRASGIPINELFAFGGGAKSDKWLQIKADILGVPIHSIATSQAGCLGAALLAAKAIGDIDSIEDAARKNSRPRKTFEPNTENMKRYDRRYEIYSDIYQTIKPIGKKINELIAVQDNL